MKWIKASERLPEGTVCARHPKQTGYFELKVMNDLILLKGFQFQKSFRFSESELYEYEWLDESTRFDEWVSEEKFIEKYIELTGYGMDMWTKDEAAALDTAAKILWRNLPSLPKK